MLTNPQSDIFKLGLQFDRGTSTRANCMIKKECEILCQSPGKSGIIVLNHETFRDEN